MNKNCLSLIRFPIGRKGENSIPYGVSHIEEKSFQSCYALYYVTIPSSVISIGDDAFDNCTNLHSVIYYGDIEPEHGENIFSEQVPREYVLVMDRYLNKTFCGMPVMIFQNTQFTQNIPSFMKYRWYVLY